MAVRAFDTSESFAPALTVLERPVRTRREVRRTRTVLAIFSLAGLAVPFLAAVVMLGVGH